MSVPKQKLILVVITFAASLGLLWMFDDGLGISWPANAVRNWQDHGLLNLHGALVDNPGGYQIQTAPHTYSGMSPLCLYPVWLGIKLFGWAGLGFFPFYFILALLVLWGIWSLLGKTPAGLVVALVTLLCPGYGRWLIAVDPNAISVLLGIPYVAAVTGILTKPRLCAADCAILVLLTAVFVPLNWTTAWVLAPFGIFLLIAPRLRRGPVLIFLTLTAVGAIAFVGSSMMHKSAGHVGGQSFLGGYTWGNYGYGEGLSTSRAFVRIGFTTIAGLLPLLLIWGAFAIRKPVNLLVALMPLAMAILMLVAMRNYFGHHPWMASPLAIVGLILSIRLLSDSPPEVTPPARDNLKPMVFIVLGCLIYGVTVVTFYRTNGSEGRMLTALVRHNSPRLETIAVVKNLDPATVNLADRLDTELDRHVIVVDDLNGLPKDEPCAILSAVPVGSLTLIAEGQVGSGSGLDSRLQQFADWFNHAIAHRNPGDRMDIARHYYLYRAPE